MKKIRRNAIFIILLGIISMSAIFYYEYMGKDSKGEIFYNDELIAKEGDSYNYFSREGSIDLLTFKRFSGVETVYVSGQDQTIHLDLNYGIDFGNFKVVIVRQNNEVIVSKMQQIMIPK